MTTAVRDCPSDDECQRKSIDRKGKIEGKAKWNKPYEDGFSAQARAGSSQLDHELGRKLTKS